jgi:hypothetical protein
MVRWLEPQPADVPAALRSVEAVDLPVGALLIAELLVRRGIDDPAQRAGFT